MKTNNINQLWYEGTFTVLVIWLTSIGQGFGYFNPYSDYATEVVEYSGQFGSSPYDDPNAILGEPATDFIDPGGMSGGDPERTVKLVEAAFNIDAGGNKLITTLLPNDYIVVRFDHKVVDYPDNLYGADFIVFGNSAFFGNGFVNQFTDMNTYLLTSGGTFEATRVSVSQDAQTWYSYDSGPWADSLFPTQAYVWDRQDAQWTDQKMDFTRPVDPNLTFSEFSGLNAADAIDHYDGSGGGTPFDLKNLADYEELAVDPNSGCRWIQYVRFDGVDSPQGAEIDAVSDVAACGDPTHPHLPGDVNLDCRIDFIDFSLMAENWLECTFKCD